MDANKIWSYILCIIFWRESSPCQSGNDHSTTENLHNVAACDLEVFVRIFSMPSNLLNSSNLEGMSILHITNQKIIIKIKKKQIVLSSLLWAHQKLLEHEKDAFVPCLRTLSHRCTVRSLLSATNELHSARYSAVTVWAVRKTPQPPFACSVVLGHGAPLLCFAFSLL